MPAVKILSFDALVAIVFFRFSHCCCCFNGGAGGAGGDAAAAISGLITLRRGGGVCRGTGTGEDGDSGIGDGLN